MGRPAHKAEDLTAIREPIVKKVWEPRRLSRATTACYRDSFIFVSAIEPKFAFSFTNFLRNNGFETGPLSLVGGNEKLLE